MKNSDANFWNKLSLSHKISLIGSVALIGSLFLNWFSDIDVFRSGDQYTGLSGPLYFVGFNLLLLAIANIGLILAKTWNVRMVENFSEIKFGKYQIIAGFVSMYLMMIVNSVYFHPQFGLNILSKKSEIGMFVAMMAAVMLCVGGYMSYRKKFEEMDTSLEEMEVEEEISEQVTEQVETLIQPNEEVQRVEEAPRAFSGGIKRETPAYQEPAAAVRSSFNTAQTGKTDYERSKMYENLKKMMVKDTMSPDQRRKEREKQVKENAFSANFGKTETLATKNNSAVGIDDLLRKGQLKKPAGESAVVGAKKPQMYRMDL